MPVVLLAPWLEAPAPAAPCPCTSPWGCDPWLNTAMLRTMQLMSQLEPRLLAVRSRRAARQPAPPRRRSLPPPSLHVLRPRPAVLPALTP